MASIKLEEVNFAYRLNELKPGGGLLRRKFKSRLALDRVSFELKKGDIVGLIGHNGGGKSTLLKLLSGVLKPTRGRLDTSGEILSLLDRNAGTMREATLYENAKLKATSLGLKGKAIDEFIDRSIEESGMLDRKHEPLKNLSAGMVGQFSLALNTQLVKPITILDEWISTLDTKTVSHKGLLDRAVEEADIVVLASHNRGLVRRLCNKVILLDGGRIRYSGSDIDSAYRLLDATKNNNLKNGSHGKELVHFLSFPPAANAFYSQYLAGENSEKYKFKFHPIEVTLRDIPPGEKVCFLYREPVERYIKSFCLRYHKGQPFGFEDWTESERKAFNKFKTPEVLAAALSSNDRSEMFEAFNAMGGINSVRRHQSEWLIGLDYLKTRREDILCSVNASCLEDSLPVLFEVLELPLDVNRNNSGLELYSSSGTNSEISEVGVKNIEEYYKDDMEIVFHLDKQSLLS